VERKEIERLLEQQIQKREKAAQMYHQLCGAVSTLQALLREYDREDADEQNGE